MLCVFFLKEIEDREVFWGDKSQHSRIRHKQMKTEGKGELGMEKDGRTGHERGGK